MSTRKISSPEKNSTVYFVIFYSHRWEKRPGGPEIIPEREESSAHAENVGLDAIDFFERVLLFFLIGNCDMHLKNRALLIRGKKPSLALVYDFVSSRVCVKKESDSALTINAKSNHSSARTSRT